MASIPSPIPLMPLLAAAASLATAHADLPMQTRHATVNIDDKGFITSLKSKASGKDYTTDKGGKKIAGLEMNQPAKLAPGESQVGVRLELDKPGKIRIALTTYVLGKGEPVSK